MPRYATFALTWRSASACLTALKAHCLVSYLALQYSACQEVCGYSDEDYAQSLVQEMLDQTRLYLTGNTESDIASSTHSITTSWETFWSC